MVDGLAFPDSFALRATTALVIAEEGAAALAALDALALAECRARGRIGFDEAARDPARFDGLDLIVIEAEGAPDALFDIVFARTDAIATERGLAVIATVSPDQIDAAAALLLGPRAQLLCRPSEAERVGAIALAKYRARCVLNDATRDPETIRLQRLNEEVARIADTLVRLTRGSDDGRVRAPAQAFPDQGPEPAEIAPHEVRAVIRARRMRAQFFDDGLFGDPAWDMLLDLFASHLEDRQVSVSSLCIAAAVPPTTALRWIGQLNEAGLFERRADPSDRRRAWVGLSAKALSAMRDYASAAKRAGFPMA